MLGQPQRRLTSVYDLVKTRWVPEVRAYSFWILVQFTAAGTTLIPVKSRV